MYIEHTFPGGSKRYIEEEDLCKCKVYLKSPPHETCLACLKYTKPNYKEEPKPKKK